MKKFLTDLLRRENAPDPVDSARVPDDALIFAIGDIHGSIDLLMDLEAQIVKLAASRPETTRRIICLGDYIDRGYHSREVIEHLSGPAPAGFERICLLGNHEDYLLRFFDSPARGPAWLANVGRETLMSYGVTLPRGDMKPHDVTRAQEDLLVRMPDHHRAFLRGLARYHVEGDYLFVHAGVRPGVALADQLDDDLFWIRGDFLDSNANFGHVVVHGHTVFDEPEIHGNRIAIDTGAYASGRLTALVLAGGSRSFLRS